MRYFPLEYSRSHRRLQNIQQFTSRDDAGRAYAAAESAARGHDDLEVVLIGADSLDTIKQTHGQYFGRAPRHARGPPAGPAGPDGLGGADHVAVDLMH